MISIKNSNQIKKKFQIPPNLESCHTAKAGDYVIEGHIPAEDIKRLLREKPDIRGLVVPGMPGGSPGMESSPYQPYKVLSLGKDGKTGIFSSH